MNYFCIKLIDEKYKSLILKINNDLELDLIGYMYQIFPNTIQTSINFTRGMQRLVSNMYLESKNRSCQLTFSGNKWSEKPLQPFRQLKIVANKEEIEKIKNKRFNIDRKYCCLP